MLQPTFLPLLSCKVKVTASMIWRLKVTLIVVFTAMLLLPLAGVEPSTASGGTDSPTTETAVLFPL